MDERAVLLQLLLSRPSLGDILKLGERRDDIPVVVGHETIVPLTDDLLAVGTEIPVDAVEAAVARLQPFDDTADLFSLCVYDQLLPRRADEFVALVPENLSGRVVHPRDVEPLGPLDDTEW